MKAALRAAVSNVPSVKSGPVMAAELTDVLRRTRLLSSVPDADLAELARASRVRLFRRGQVVCTMGDPGDTLIVVISGRVKVAIRSADGAELTLAVVGPGATIGEVSIADGGPRSADAETLEDSQLLLLPREPVQDICARVPTAGQALATVVAAMLRRLTEATADLVFLDLPRRVAKVLLSQPRDGDGVIRPHLTQEQLARQAAGSRQSVNAALQGFERRGWITVNGRALTVRQPQMLARFAGDLGPGKPAQRPRHEAAARGLAA
jgi:CRP-like cAMP-binding protein